MWSDATNTSIFKDIFANHVMKNSTPPWFLKDESNPKIITSMMQLYFTDESLRDIGKFIRALKALMFNRVTQFTDELTSMLYWWKVSKEFYVVMGADVFIKVWWL